MDEALRALNRFGLGARPGERGRMRDPKGWLRAQLEGEPDPVDGAGLEEIGGLLREVIQAERENDEDRIMPARAALNDLRLREAMATLSMRVRTETPFVERLVAFWSNHLCVSVPAERRVGALAGHYERAAIRPHVLGRFEEMVLASARHPAMQFYLDNFQSMGPESVVGQRTSRGLNENYARELLELHTLGVEGGYDQVDVMATASVLSGWGVGGYGPASRAEEPLRFVFRARTHQPGSKSVMGRQYGPGGSDEGEQLIRDLCAHPATAAFLARKLVVHFVADEPPPGTVERIAETFQGTHGDLRSVAEALIDLEEAWEATHRKFRTPQDWVVAVLRAFRARNPPERLVAALAQLRHALWSPAAPNGYGDLQREWADPDSLLNRAELARSLAREFSRAWRIDPWHLLDLVDSGEANRLATLLEDSSIQVPERLALAVAGPAFQWR